MLLEFKCSNHKSIRDEVVFSMLCSSDESHEENIIHVSGIKALKSAVIYGANGSGKTNLIEAFSFVKMLVMKSIYYAPGEGIQNTPYKKDGYKKESHYNMQFVTGGCRYAFGFALADMVVKEEYLYYFPNGRQTKIFERKGDRFTAGSKFRGKFNNCKEVLKPNRLLLSCAANFSNVPEVTSAYRFFADELVVFGNSIQDRWTIYSLYQMNSNEELKKAVLTLLSELGTDIKDIHIAIDEEQMNPKFLPPFLSDEYKNKLLEEKVNIVSAKVAYDNCDDLDIDLMGEESNGIKKLFGILCPLIDVMINGKVLLCDELEAGLHESLVFGLVRLFIKTQMPKDAQLIFTTHETGLLSLDLLRRDQIWFTELRKMDRATDLYSLAEIKSIRKEENFGKGYISGKYGAIPMLNLDFAKTLSAP